MKIHISRRSKKLGAPPGTLIHIGKERTADVVITRCCYDENTYNEQKKIPLDTLFTTEPRLAVQWVNFDGIHNVEIIEKIGSYYGIDTLVLEDIVNTSQRAKIEDYGDYIYIVLKLLTCNIKNCEIESEQVSIILYYM